MPEVRSVGETEMEITAIDSGAATTATFQMLGNVLFDAEHPWLIDPAVYSGDREADLAMTEMFGGFGTGFYEAYDRVYPRSVVYEQKRDIYNLYHYLNHYNLFGSGYLEGCKRGFSMVKRVAANA